MKRNVKFSSLNSICRALEATYSQTGVKTTLIFPQNLYFLKYFSALCIIVPPKRPLTSGFTGCFNHYCGHFTLPFYSVFHVNNTTSSNFSQNDLFSLNSLWYSSKQGGKLIMNSNIGTKISYEIYRQFFFVWRLLITWAHVKSLHVKELSLDLIRYFCSNIWSWLFFYHVSVNILKLNCALIGVFEVVICFFHLCYFKSSHSNKEKSSQYS